VLPAVEEAIDVNELEKMVRELSLPRRELKWHGCGPMMEDGMPIVASFLHEETEEAREVSGDLENLIRDGLPATIAVETSLTAPALFPILPHYCQKENVTVDPGSGDVEAHESLFRRSGILLMADCIRGSSLDRLMALAQDRIAWCDRGLKKRGLDLNDEKDFMFQEVASRGSQRGDLLFENPLPVEVFSAVREAPWVPLVSTILKEVVDDLTCSVSIIYSRPGSGEQEWHADGPHLRHYEEP